MFVDDYLSSLLEEFNGVTGLAILFLFGIFTQTQNSFFALVGLIALAVLGLVRGIFKAIHHEIYAEGTENQFREFGELLLNKKDENSIERVKFTLLFLMAPIMMIIEVYVLLFGFYRLLVSGIVVNQLITLIWAVYLYKFVKKWSEVFLTDFYREFVVKFNRELPGKTFWKSNDED
jgi:hypothetical protein